MNIILTIILITRRTCVPLQWAAQPIPWGEGLSDNSLQWDSNSFSSFILIPFHIPLFSSSDYLFIFSSPLLLQVSWPASLEICLSCLIPRPIKLWWGLRRKRNNSIFCLDIFINTGKHSKILVFFLGISPKSVTLPFGRFRIQNVIFRRNSLLFSGQKQAFKDIFWKFRTPTSDHPPLFKTFP